MFGGVVALILLLQLAVETTGFTRTLDGNTTIPVHSDVTFHNPNLLRSRPASRPRKDDDCTSEILRKVMNEHISDSGMSDSKRAIHAAAKRDFEGSWSVICAPCAFSYLAHAQEFCVHSRHGITCLLYRDG